MAFIVKRDAPIIQAGIVAASAGSLIIDFGYFSGETYAKISNIFWNFNFGEGNSEYQRLQWNSFISNTWTLDVNNGDIVATNPSTNSLIIPTNGWIYLYGDGPAITITAA